MPTGLFNSPVDAVASAPVKNIGPRGAICDTYQIVFAVTGQVARFPFVIVPIGATVTLRGDNGSAANAQPAFAARYPALLSQPGRATITPDTEITFPVDNLGQIFAAGTAGDGLIATVRAGALA